jgi:hypothetical protein
MDPNSLITIARTNPEIIAPIVQAVIAVGIFITAIFTACAARAAKSSAKATMRTALATMETAKATEQAAKATKQVAQGQFLHDLLSEYSSEEMLKALKNMGDLYEGYKDNMATLKTNYETSPEAFNDETESSRRRVLHYFQRALELYDNQKCIDIQCLQTICKLDGFGLLYKVVEWLDLAINPKYDHEKYDRLLKLSGLSEGDKQKLQSARP